MLAARWHARHDVRVEDIDDPGDPPPGWLRLRVLACGICGTDVEEYDAGPTVIPVEEPNALTGRKAPLTLGHESVGVVESVGAGVQIDVGTPVAVEGTIACGRCPWCATGDVNLCADVAWLGLRGDGGLAEQMLAPATSCVPFDDAVRADRMALAEPLSVAVRAASRGELRPGMTVGVVGCGTVGLLLVQLARQLGASTVVAVEPHDNRRDVARAVGADAATAPDDAREAVADLTHVGLDVVFEVTGNVAGVSDTVALTRRGGTAVVLGIFPPAPVPLNLTDIVLGEKRLVASLSHTMSSDFPRAVQLLADGTIDADPIITDRIALTDVVDLGLQELLRRPQDHLKILVNPQPVGA